MWKSNDEILILLKFAISKEMLTSKLEFDILGVGISVAM